MGGMDGGKVNGEGGDGGEDVVVGVMGKAEGGAHAGMLEGQKQPVKPSCNKAPVTTMWPQASMPAHP